MFTQTLAISGITIHQDSESRFCLNDFHKAAGNNPKDAPAQFFRNDKTKRLVELLTSDVQNCTSSKINNLTPINVIKGNFSNGIEQGTYVVKPLVYAYAMWISPEFHLHVINAYDALVTGQIFDFLKPITDPITPEDFKWRHQAITNAFQNLKNATVTATFNGSELLVGKRLVKSKRLF